MWHKIYYVKKMIFTLSTIIAELIKLCGLWLIVLWKSCQCTSAPLLNNWLPQSWSVLVRCTSSRITNKDTQGPLENIYFLKSISNNNSSPDCLSWHLPSFMTGSFTLCLDLHTGMPNRKCNWNWTLFFFTIFFYFFLHLKHEPLSQQRKGAMLTLWPIVTPNDILHVRAGNHHFFLELLVYLMICTPRLVLIFLTMVWNPKIYDLEWKKIIWYFW